jgi:predicted dehydrogenase
MDYLLNSTPQAVSATGMAHFGNELENMAYISTFYPKKVMGHIHVNWLAPVKVRKTLICGSKKMVVYDDMEPSDKVKIYDRGVNMVENREEIYDMLIQYRTGDMLAPKIDLTEALKKIAREFYDAVNEKRTPRTDGRSGWQVVRILEAANESIKNNGQIVELK